MSENHKLKEGKYLVVGRDGAIPKWPHFVIGGDDPAWPARLREDAVKARQLGYADPDFCDSIVALADGFAGRAVEAAATAAHLGTKGADPDARLSGRESSNAK